MIKPYTCPGCGTKIDGDAGAHARYFKACTSEMRFWGRIKKGPDCWLWQGAVNTTGYGMASWEGRKNIVAHRLAYKLLRGPIPAGKLALHRCDTPRCCNPDHLFFGTDADNMADKVAKRRQVHGERMHTAKLTEEDVLEIRRLKGIERGKTIAARFGVATSHISNIWTRRLWKHLP